MSLNLKNPETHRLVRELADLTGENMTDAVTSAVRKRLDRMSGSGTAGMANRLLAIDRVCSAHLREPFRSVDHGNLLYGEDGLPK